MPVATQLLAFGLRQVIDVPPDLVENVVGVAVDVAASAGTAGKVFALVRRRLTDHGEALPKALAAANDRAWQAVAVALAGRGFFTSVKEFFTGRTPKALHEQVEAFLAQNADSFPGTTKEFRQTCLSELRQAQKAGLLSAGQPDPDGWARQAAAYRGLADPQGRVGESRQAAAAVAGALPREYANLARLLKEAAPPGQAPLLVGAFSFFLQRQVATNDELSRGLTFAGLRQLSERQEAGFEALGQGLADITAQLAGQGQQFGDILDGMQQIVGMLGAMRAELAELAARNHVHDGPPKPQFIITINNEREQALARRLLAEVRKLPPEWQNAADLSLLGNVLRAAGLYPEAKESYAEAAAQAEDRAAQAANHYKMYLTALEQRRWDEGLAALTAAADLDAPHYAPFPLRKYEPRRILGAGGFGTAFLCRDRFLNREFVIKSLFRADLERGLDKVFAEAQTLLLLSKEHDSIIGVQDCNFADDAQERPYIVMDYFPGVSLQAHLDQLGPKAGLPLEDFLPIARQIAGAMLAAHGRGILHRDLKPDNVLVLKKDGRWQVKVIDFGLAVRLRTVQVSTSRPVSERTMYGSAVAGTARYASPEQMGEMPGIEPDTYSDVYTFGKLCCYALFRDTEPKRRQWASLPAELADMLERCVEKDLEHRARTFQPVLDVLKALDPGEAARRRQELDMPPNQTPPDIDLQPMEQTVSGPGVDVGNRSSGREARMSKHALLLRLNPDRWPVWERVILPDSHSEVWFKTGRLRPEDIHADIPVIILGTSGLGVVAFGTTSSVAECRTDPDWQEASPEYQEECRRPENRVRVKIKRVTVSLAQLQEQTATAKLHHRRETTTWIDEDQYQVIRALIQS